MYGPFSRRIIDFQPLLAASLATRAAESASQASG
jgi:hypothetical protein